MLATLLIPAINLPSLLIWTGSPRCLFLAGANQERVALSEPHSSGPSGRKSDVSPRQKQTLMRNYALSAVQSKNPSLCVEFDPQTNISVPMKSSGLLQFSADKCNTWPQIYVIRRSTQSTLFITLRDVDGGAGKEVPYSPSRESAVRMMERKGPASPDTAHMWRTAKIFLSSR
jgi:hypothetical protein